MSLVNVAYRDALTWANQDLRTLEQQALLAAAFPGETNPVTTGNVALNTPPGEELVFTCHNTGVNDDAGTFRVPTLRNIAVTAPYMHDGSVATLDDALAITTSPVDARTIRSRAPGSSH